MANNQAHDPVVATAPERAAAPVALTVAAVANGVASGFVAESGFSLTDNGDGTLTVTDAQARFGTKPNGVLPVWYFDFGGGSDQPHPTLSRQQLAISWKPQCTLSQAVTRDGSTHAMIIDTAVADGSNPVFETGDATLQLPANAGRKYFRHYVVYNDFTYTELTDSITANTATTSENLKHHRWQPSSGQSSHYLACTMQANNYRFDFAGDGVSIYDSKLYTPSSELATKRWRVEEEYHQVSSAQGATDAIMIGALDGVKKFERANVDSHNGTDPTLPENQWDHYKLANFNKWGAPGDCPWLSDILYVDDSWCKIYITDKPTWDEQESKALEIQIPTGWAAGELDFHFRLGALASTSGNYLWAVDNNDTKILVGGWS